MNEPTVWISLVSLAVAVLNGALLFLRTGKTDHRNEGALAQRLTDVEKRTGKLESDVQTTERAVSDIRVVLATIPEQIKGQKELMTVQFEGLNHAVKNLRMAVEALGRRESHGSRADA